ncbi:MAG: hypothetical protein U9Q67_02415 [Patescibacteria group bacterium]|nr:hypothetical protein [Patescibacteria group bacterium]
MNKKLPVLIIRSHTAEGEFNYLWDILVNRLATYTRRGWSVSVPNDPYFSQVTPNHNPLDKDEAREKFVRDIYDASFFQNAIKNMEKERKRIMRIFPVFKEYSRKWGFNLFPKYEIVFTRYGVGGSYLYKKGLSQAIILTNKEGTSKRPCYAQNPIHEFVHTGINEPIVKKYGLKHNEKERIVDFICITGLKEVILEYEATAEKMPLLDRFLTNESLEDLPAAIHEYRDCIK